MEVTSPGPDRTIVSHSQAVTVAAKETSSGDSCDGREVNNLNGYQTQSGSAVTKLAAPVISPGPNRPVFIQGKRVASADANGAHIYEAAHLDRAFGIRCGIATDGESDAPSPDCSVALKCDAMSISCSQGDNTSQSSHLCRR